MTNKQTNTKRTLSATQQEHCTQLLQTMYATQGKLDKQSALRDAAQETHGIAQQAANQFVVFCAKELGVPLGQDGWTFNQAQLCFEQVPVPPAGEGDEQKG